MGAAVHLTEGWDAFASRALPPNKMAWLTPGEVQMRVAFATFSTSDFDIRFDRISMQSKRK